MNNNGNVVNTDNIVDIYINGLNFKCNVGVEGNGLEMVNYYENAYTSPDMKERTPFLRELADKTRNFVRNCVAHPNEEEGRGIIHQGKEDFLLRDKTVSLLANLNQIDGFRKDIDKMLLDDNFDKMYLYDETPTLGGGGRSL